jgi:hypothetical protein
VQPRLAREQTDQRARAGACVEGVIVEPAQAGGTRHDVRAQGLQAAVARPRHGDRHRLHRRQFRQDQPRQRVAAGGPIWVSILGAAPFTLALPYADLFWTGVLSVVIGLVMSSAFSAIVVFAQELVPGKIGMIAGIFFGLMFGVSGIGAYRGRGGDRDVVSAGVVPAVAGGSGGVLAKDRSARVTHGGHGVPTLRHRDNRRVGSPSPPNARVKSPGAR